MSECVFIFVFPAHSFLRQPFTITWQKIEATVRQRGSRGRAEVASVSECVCIIVPSLFTPSSAVQDNLANRSEGEGEGRGGACQ